MKSLKGKENEVEEISANKKNQKPNGKSLHKQTQDGRKHKIKAKIKSLLYILRFCKNTKGCHGS